MGLGPFEHFLGDWPGIRRLKDLQAKNVVSRRHVAYKTFTQ